MPDIGGRTSVMPEPMRGHQRLERIHVLDGGEVTGDGADLVAHA